METNNEPAPDKINQPLPRQNPPKFNRPTKYILMAAIAVVLIIGAALAFKFLPFRPASQTQNQAATQQPTTDISDLTSTTTIQYPIDNALQAIPNYSDVAQKLKLNLSPAQQKYLENNHFVLVNTADTAFASNYGYNFDEMLTDFDYLTGSASQYYRTPDNTKLVTPDVVLHTYHKFFDMTLEQLEQKELAQSLGDFLNSLYGNLLGAEQNSTGYTQTRYQNLLAQMTVARVLFENKNGPKPDSFNTPDQENAYNQQDQTVDSYDNAKTILAKYTAGLTPDLISAAQSELGNIYQASKVGTSPLFGQYSATQKTDYTQFTPRSHYTKNSAFRAYFRTMMYLGRSSYFLQTDNGIADASLLVKQFQIKNQSGITPVNPWQKIMTVTAFYAGQSDDLTYNEWQSYEKSVLGTAQPADADLTSQTGIQKMATNLNQVRLPKILSDVVVDENISSETKSDLLRQSLAFRVFGQSFSFDAWVLNDLTAGQEKTDVKLPSTPSALFIPAAMGSVQAKTYSGQFLQKDAGFSDSDVQGFLTKLSQKQSDIGKVTQNEWFASMGSAWLYVLGSLTHSYDSTYPAYMQATPFLDKQLQTFLGSYTELKHDTLLYAKQSYAEKGGGGDENPALPPVVKGYVEPNLDFWNRFNSLISQTKQVFSQNNLFSNTDVSARLQNFQDIVTFYTSIANQEMQGKAISEKDYEKLRTTQLSFMVQPFDAATQADENSGKVALIADIATDAIKNQVLYEADARPYLMLAIVNNENSPRVVTGLTYNQYEFTNPLGGQRLTDDDWKTWVYDQTNKLPAKNFWYNSLEAK
ncbi:MAG: DUF3160 domain-containing protein [Candidatus Doudnabacteria bacterium]|nr:DUF3160 domain-containing protein [Candidatus Doudnabacteria bacterium]